MWCMDNFTWLLEEGIKMKKFSAFTMAEILLSLTIIGVVAAITLPSLTGNINERVWNTQRKALYARFSQALAIMPQLNGYGQYEGTNTDGVVIATTDTAAETFVTEGLSKVLKINNICDATHLADCGIPSSLTTLVGSAMTFPTKMSELNSMFVSTYNDGGADGGEDYMNPQKDIDTRAVAFETQNGESIAVFYNPQCQADLDEIDWHYSQPKMCANFIYDLNGNKGPNAVGKDIGFITALYASTPVIVSPQPLATNNNTRVSLANASNACTTQDDEIRLPNRDELAAMFYNKDLIGLTTGGFWSSSIFSTDKAWEQNFSSGNRGPTLREGTNYSHCIKR